MADSNIKAEKIECQELIVDHPDSEYKITALAAGGVTGLWLAKKGPENNVCLGLCTDAGIPTIEFYTKDGKCNLAIYLNEDGQPTLQVSNGKEVFFLEYKDLEKLVK